MEKANKLELLEHLHTVLIQELLDKVKSGIECIPTEKSPMEDLMSNLPDLDVIPALER